MLFMETTQQKQGLMQSFNMGRREGLRFFFSKPPIWSEEAQAQVLNFGGRVDKHSVKNFQLIDQEDDNVIYMEFGRVDDDSFNLDFQWPFSPMQALAVALSSFDGKLLVNRTRKGAPQPKINLKAMLRHPTIYSLQPQT
eukprot:TRINITY_DN5186_c0_g1_i13.p3 TRINITY_DN5186_c0_g1~~TRINITY_DN5186_c0_g1_i13.p3  ORF type:complete len:139 (-),score=0.30 TRINITY_DN5186_c0_g1_i13:428-844(-)